MNSILISPVIVIGTPRSGTSIVAKWLIENYGAVMTLDGYTTANDKYKVGETLEDLFVTNCNSMLNHKKISRRYYRYLMKGFFKKLKVKAGNKPWGFKDPRLTNGLPWILEHFGDDMTIIRTRRYEELVAKSMVEKLKWKHEKAVETIVKYRLFFNQVLKGRVVIDVHFDSSLRMPEEFTESFVQSLIDKNNMLRKK